MMKEGRDGGCIVLVWRLYYWRVWVQEENGQTGDPARQNPSQILFHFCKIQLLPHLQGIPRAAWETPADAKRLWGLFNLTWYYSFRVCLLSTRLSGANFTAFIEKKYETLLPIFLSHDEWVNKHRRPTREDMRRIWLCREWNIFGIWMWALRVAR